MHAPDRPNRWKRYEIWDRRPLRLDTFAVEDPERGFCATNSPHDPRPSLKVENGRVVEMDGIAEPDFDMIDIFIARHHLDLEVAAEAMGTDSLAMARMLLDIDVPRDSVVRLADRSGPARRHVASPSACGLGQPHAALPAPSRLGRETARVVCGSNRCISRTSTRSRTVEPIGAI